MKFNVSAKSRKGLDGYMDELKRRVHSIKVEAVREFYDYQVPEGFEGQIVTETVIVGDKAFRGTTHKTEHGRFEKGEQDKPIWSGSYMANWHVSHGGKSSTLIGTRKWIPDYWEALKIGGMYAPYIQPGKTDAAMKDADYRENPDMFVTNTAPYAHLLNYEGGAHGNALFALENGFDLVIGRIHEIVKNGLKKAKEYK